NQVSALARLPLILLALLTAWVGSPAYADELRPAVIELSERQPGEWSLDWKLPIAASRSPVGEANTQIPVIPENCSFANPPVVRMAPLAQFGHAELTCDGQLAGRPVGLEELLGSSDALLRVVPFDASPQTFRLTAAAPTAIIAAGASRWQVARSYFAIGVEHILLGWDHLLFVIALVLLVSGAWSVIKAATAFTIAHSITLVATTLGYAGLPGRPVEALIALSIVFLAVELAKAIRHPERKTWTRRAPWLVAFGFGLLHGFGFAGALAEIGLPAGEVPAALLAFNIGVEAGQLLVIAAVLVLRALIAKLAPRAEPPALKFATYAIGITASYWLFERILL
ncbi:MAG: HupE/UreJ family protein, partial [Pseudomonadota bacterium]